MLMCFSATASFGAGTILSVIGAASLKKVNQPRQYLFAAIPLLFAVQQFAEGVLWLVLPYHSDLSYELAATSIFIVIAQIVWPIWVPLSIQQIERNSTVRKILSVFTGLGIIVSICLAWLFFKYDVNAEIRGHHIFYIQSYPVLFKNIGGYFYVIVTVFPTFLSNYRRIWMLGLAILVSYVITELFFNNFLISVWCFFAAIISGVLYFVLLEIQSKTSQHYTEVTEDVA